MATTLAGLAALLVLAAPGVAAATPAGPPAAEDLVRRATALRLHESATWRKLLHYVPAAIGGARRSLVDSPEFFLDPQGSTDPARELSATVRALFARVEPTPRGEPLQCRFLARYLWLQQALQAPTSFRPESDCPQYGAWIGEIDPLRAVLVFPAAYLNNPSSMYGHTLLRLDGPATPSGSTLYSYAINFAAVSAETNGFLFAVKGLTGLYPGEFSVMPYFRKVTEYSDLESRDLWEYPLNLSPQELRFMLAHLWELRDIRFDYYFLDENCSYQLLALLEVAREELDLTSPFVTHAIPSDTLKVALAGAGLEAAEAVYRPSLASRVRQRQEQLRGAELELLDRLVEDRITPADPSLLALPPARQALVLEAAYDYLQYRHYRERRQAVETSPVALRLLRRRSQIDAEPGTAEAVRPGSAPHLGHPSRRLDFGLGHDRAGDYLRLKLRPAYHDLLDPPQGFLPGAQVNMFGVDLRADADGAFLDTFEFVDIFSLAPREALFPLHSWRFNASLRRLPLEEDRPPLGLSLEGGYGLAFGSQRWIRFALVEAGLQLSGELEQEALPALGLRIGLLAHPSDRWGLLASAVARRQYGELDRDDWRLALEQRFDSGPDQAIRVDLAVERRGDVTDNAVQVSWQHYF